MYVTHKITLTFPDNVLIRTSYNTVTYFNSYFINVLSFCRYICQCFICYFQVSVWQLLTIPVLHPSVNIANISGCCSNDLKIPYYGG